MENGVLFSELRIYGKPLRDCEMVLECNNRHYRLYVVKDVEEEVFYSLAVEFLSCESVHDIWDCPELRVEPLFNTTAYFDGVRHLEFNRESEDMAGYIYYPDMQGLIDMFEKLREIEVEVCQYLDE